MILPDHEIRKLLKEGRLVIEPLEDPKIQIQPAWVDLRLGNEFRVFKHLSEPFVDIKDGTKDYTESVIVREGEAFVLHPKEFVIGITRERIGLPADMVAFVDGRSSLGRLGITAHVTSSWVDPCFKGKLALEITNLGKMPVKIYPGMRICKLVLFKLSSAASLPYDKRPAKYNNQDGPGPSKISQDFVE